LQRAEVMKGQLKGQLRIEKSNKVNASATEQLSDLMNDCASEVLFWKEKLVDSKTLVWNL